MLGILTSLVDCWAYHNIKALGNARLSERHAYVQDVYYSHLIDQSSQLFHENHPCIHASFTSLNSVKQYHGFTSIERVLYGSGMGIRNINHASFRRSPMINIAMKAHLCSTGHSLSMKTHDFAIPVSRLTPVLPRQVHACNTVDRQAPSSILISISHTL